MTGARWLEGRAAPWALGALVAAAVAVTWGIPAAPIPVMHDEWAYWTQAGQYAALRWSVPSPPLPEFFEQLYVLVTPVFAAKYWPGHAIALAPGFAIGVPALMPLLLTLVTSALVFLLARRVAGPRVALATVLIWATTFGNLRFRATYFSELTTSCAWLVAWWALLEWRERGGTKWMMVMAAATGWGAITRPATMLLFAIPLGVVVLRDTVRGARWRSLSIGLVTGIAVLGVLPLWSARVTGEASTPPLGTYTRAYLPFDLPGYHVDSTPPTRALPPEMERVRGFLRDIKVEQATAPVLATFTSRVGLVLGDAFNAWRAPLLIAFVLGAMCAGAAGWFALGTSLLLIVGYLSQAHTADWSVYYLETFPVLAFVAAIGVRCAWRFARRRGLEAARLETAARAAIVVALVLSVRDVVTARTTLGRVSALTRSFREGVASLPKKPNIVFVRYSAGRNMHLSLVANDGVLEAAQSWIVHDHGADDARLMSAAPSRTAYLYVEERHEFMEIRP